MDLQQIKRWHWCVLALLIGGLATFVWLSLDQPAAARTISKDEFEQAVTRGTSYTREPLLTGVVVFPKEDGEQLVLGERWVNMGWRRHGYMAFSLHATLPYVSQNTGTSYPSVQARLRAAQSRNPNLSYRYEWWRSPIDAYAAGCGGSLLLIGILLPMLLSALGLVDFEAHRPAPAGPASGMYGGLKAASPAVAALTPSPTSSPTNELDSLLDQTMTTAASGLQGSSIAPPPGLDAQGLANGANGAPAIALLTSEPLPPPPPAPEKPDPSEFRGIFYPTRTGVTKRTSTEDAT